MGEGSSAPDEHQAHHLVSLSLDSLLSIDEQCTQVLTDHLVTWTTWAELWRWRGTSLRSMGPFGTLAA